jgi:hypothetical protein
MYASGMKQALARLGMVLLIVLSFTGCGGEDAAEIRSVFDDYLRALQGRDASAFLKTIDPQIIVRYDAQVKLAQKGTKQQILRQPPFGIFEVVQMRHELTPDELRTLTGEAWVRRAIGRGDFILQDQSETYTIGRPTLRSPRASAELLVDGQKSGIRVEFVKTEGRWLVNDDCYEPMFEKELNRDLSRTGWPVERLIFAYVAESSDKELDRTILDTPPIQ